MKKSSKRILALLTALMYVVIYYAVSLIIELGYVFLQNRKRALSVSEMESNVANNSFALSVIAAIISLWLYALIGKIRKKPINKIILNRKKAPIINIMAVCLAFGGRLCVTAYYYFSQNIEMLKQSIDNASAITPQLTGLGQLITAVFAVAIIAPLFEEILFRGIVFSELRNIMRPWAAVILQAVIFGAAHMILFQSLFAFVMGILLGIVYYKTESIVTAAVCHSAFNLSVIFTGSDMTISSALIVMVMGILLISSALAYIIKFCDKKGNL